MHVRQGAILCGLSIGGRASGAAIEKKGGGGCRNVKQKNE